MMMQAWKRKKDRLPKRARARVEMSTPWRRRWRRVMMGLGIGLVIFLLGISGLEVMTSQISGKSRFTVVLATPSLALFSYQPQTAEGVLLSVPDAFMVRGAYGYGPWRAVALAGLDRQERLAGKLLQDSVTHTFGVVVDGYIAANEKMGTEIVDREGLNRLVVASLWQQFTGGVETNLSLWDLLRLMRILSTTRIDRIKEMRMSEVTRLLEMTEPGGGAVYLLDEGTLSDLSHQWFTDERVAQEGITVAVINEAQAAGLGTNVAQILSTSGVRVVAVENGAGEARESRVYTNDTFKQSKTLGVIKKLVPGIVVSDIGEGARADIILRLGKDVGERFGGGE